MCAIGMVGESNEIAADSFAIKAALHQLEPRPIGFCGVMLPGENVAVWSMVKTLHCAFVKLVS
jgi:hypothetical protein